MLCRLDTNMKDRKGEKETSCQWCIPRRAIKIEGLQSIEQGYDEII